MSTKEALRQAIGKLNEDNARVVLKFVLYLLDEEEGLTPEDLAAIKKGEEQIARGEVVTLDELKKELKL
ncbi:MAG: hypothetical protein VR67_19050 [Peptococcaceae bacterium BRH_c8a]|nr:MAG: hypothetical protein VR67_19050 [Peptococcaceae bacterium BRH_c8a]